MLIAILIVLVLGGGAAYGVSYGISYATGNETVLADRLVAQATGKAAGVTVKVEQVEVTAHYAKIKIAATNQNRTSATLPLFGNCQLVDANGATLKPGTPFGGLEPITVPPSALTRCSGHCRPNARCRWLVSSSKRRSELKRYNADSIWNIDAVRL